MDCFRPTALTSEPTIALPVPEVTDELRDRGVAEAKDVTIEGEGRPPALEPLSEPADTLTAFGRTAGDDRRADPEGEDSFVGEFRFVPKRSSSCTKLRPLVDTGEAVLEPDLDPDDFAAATISEADL